MVKRTDRSKGTIEQRRVIRNDIIEADYCKNCIERPECPAIELSVRLGSLNTQLSYLLNTNGSGLVIANIATRLAFAEMMDGVPSRFDPAFAIIQEAINRCTVYDEEIEDLYDEVFGSTGAQSVVQLTAEVHAQLDRL
jgi:hypothetical protein